MRLRRDEHGLDEIDRRILVALQQDCKLPLAKIGDQVGLSAPSVVERVRKLETEGFITGYHAALDARRLGLDVTAFIGVSTKHPDTAKEFGARLPEMEDVLECHHITGEHTLLLKVKTASTATLAELIGRLRAMPGVERTQTSVVLSTMTERTRIKIDSPKVEQAAGERTGADTSG